MFSIQGLFESGQRPVKPSKSVWDLAQIESDLAIVEIKQDTWKSLPAGATAEFTPALLWRKMEEGHTDRENAIFKQLRRELSGTVLEAKTFDQQEHEAIRFKQNLERMVESHALAVSHAQFLSQCLQKYHDKMCELWGKDNLLNQAPPGDMNLRSDRGR